MRIKSPFDMLAPKRTQQNRICDIPGCTESTREGKPYCPNHVDCLPYVQEVLSRLAERDAQDEAVSKRGPRAVDVESSLTVQEILLHLELHGPRTEERLVREVNIDAKTLGGYLRALVKRKIIKLGHTKRGSVLVKLANASPAPLQDEAGRRASA